MIEPRLIDDEKLLRSSAPPRSTITQSKSHFFIVGYILGQNFMDADELNDASQQVAQNILAERDRQ